MLVRTEWWLWCPSLIVVGGPVRVTQASSGGPSTDEGEDGPESVFVGVMVPGTVAEKAVAILERDGLDMGDDEED